MLLVMLRPLMPLSLRYTSVVSLFGLLFALNSCRHYLDEIAYCSNQRNDDTISIECCHSDDTGQFSQDTLDALVQLLNWLIKTYGLGQDDILRHYDVIGKECPYYFVKHPDAWEGLLNSLTYDNAF